MTDAAEQLVIRMEEAIALIIAARRHCAHVPELLAMTIDAAEHTLLYHTGRIVSLEARAAPLGPSAERDLPADPAAAVAPPSPHALRRPDFFSTPDVALEGATDAPGAGTRVSKGPAPGAKFAMAHGAIDAE